MLSDVVAVSAFPEVPAAILVVDAVVTSVTDPEPGMAAETPSVPVSVIVLLAVNVFPFATVRVALVVGAVIVSLFMVVAVAAPRVGVTKDGELLNTSNPEPVSSEITPANSADVVAEKALSLFEVVANRPEVGSVIDVAPVAVSVMAYAPDVVRFPAISRLPASFKVLAAFTTSSVSVLFAVSAVDEVAAIDKSYAAEVSRRLNEVRAVTDVMVSHTGCAPAEPVPVCVKNFLVEDVFGAIKPVLAASV